MKPGIYLIVDFNWPVPFKPEYGQKARELHDAVQGREWIREVLAASGGIGRGPSSVWVFWLENYAALDCLLHDADDEVGIAYRAFFARMDDVADRIREQVIFND